MIFIDRSYFSLYTIYSGVIYFARSACDSTGNKLNHNFVQAYIKEKEVFFLMVDKIKKYVLDWIYVFLIQFYNIHLYKTKGEAFFKAAIITISWIGGVHLVSSPNSITNEIGASLYLFSLALIMEYIMQLVTVKTFVPKVFPGLIVLCSTVLFMVSSAVIFDRPFETVSFDDMNLLAIIPQGIIWFDVISMIMIEKPDEKIILVEQTLKDC